ncbi:MAG: DEAD/DEAH box helicase [Hyphomicrobiaceae bacterium]
MDTPTFAELGLSAKVVAAIEAAGYANPTPIQAQAIPVAVTGRDVLGIAQTGTGKTASFVLPMLSRLESGRARARMPRSLILAPTRELAAQCAQSFEKYTAPIAAYAGALIGGVSMDDQVQKLDRGVDVLIATPGRLLDHFQRGRLMLMGVEILVIDEADRMLDMGFIPDIERICKLLPPRRQTLFFSATMPPEITRLVDQFLKDPARIEVARPATTAKTITQRFRFCASTEDWEKREILRELLRSLEVRNAIIFCNRKKDVAILQKSLAKHGFNAGALHGDMDQLSRMATLDKFRSGEIALLAASDVAARGLDIPDVSHVFNFDVSWQPDDYVHRIGRTGRAGKEGYAVSIVSPDDLKSLAAISKLTGEEPVWLGEPPTEEDIADAASRKRGRRRGGRPGADARGAGGDDRGRRRDGRRGRGEPPGEGARARSDAPREEGDEARAAERRPRREDRPHREDRPRRDDRPQRSDRPARHADDVREAPPRAARGERAERPDRAERGERTREREQRPARAAQPAPRREEGGQRDRPQQRGGGRQRGEETPFGMGNDHIPAFLRRPVRISAD